MAGKRPKKGALCPPPTKGGKIGFWKGEVEKTPHTSFDTGHAIFLDIHFFAHFKHLALEGNVCKILGRVLLGVTKL